MTNSSEDVNSERAVSTQLTLATLVAFLTVMIIFWLSEEFQFLYNTTVPKVCSPTIASVVELMVIVCAEAFEEPLVGLIDRFLPSSGVTVEDQPKEGVVIVNESLLAFLGIVIEEDAVVAKVSPN